jgi:hypothetical protein
MAGKWDFKIEARTLPSFYEWMKDPVRKGRLQSQIDWAFAKAKKYLRLHVFLLIASIGLNAAIPVFVELADCPMPWAGIITGASFLAAVIAALREGFKVRELWRYYRFALEYAKSQCSQAYSRVESYKGMTADQAERQVLAACERYLTEHALGDWERITGSHESKLALPLKGSDRPS